MDISGIDSWAKPSSAAIVYQWLKDFWAGESIGFFSPFFLGSANETHYLVPGQVFIRCGVSIYRTGSPSCAVLDLNTCKSLLITRQRHKNKMAALVCKHLSGTSWYMCDSVKDWFCSLESELFFSPSHLTHSVYVWLCDWTSFNTGLLWAEVQSWNQVIKWGNTAPITCLNSKSHIDL